MNFPSFSYDQFAISSDTHHAFWLGVVTSVVAMVVWWMFSAVRALIWRLLIVAARSVFYVIRVISGLAQGTLRITETVHSSDHEKFPPVENLEWHPQFSRIVSAIRDRTAAIVSGPAGAGCTELSLAALREIGFPQSSNPVDCNFLSIDCESKPTSESVLDSILEGNGISVSAQEGVQRKIERLGVLSQSKYCSTFICGLKFLPKADLKVVMSLPQRTSTEFKFAFSARSTTRFDAPEITKVNLAPLTVENIADLCQAYPNSSIKSLNHNDLADIVEITKGALTPLSMAVRASSSRDKFFQLLSEAGDEAGIVKNAILRPFRGMSDNQRRAIVFVARYGGPEKVTGTKFGESRAKRRKGQAFFVCNASLGSRTK